MQSVISPAAIRLPALPRLIQYSMRLSRHFSLLETRPREAQDERCTVKAEKMSIFQRVPYARFSHLSRRQKKQSPENRGWARYATVHTSFTKQGIFHCAMHLPDKRANVPECVNGRRVRDGEILVPSK